jgi:hypothetical protein
MELLMGNSSMYSSINRESPVAMFDYCNVSLYIYMYIYNLESATFGNQRVVQAPKVAFELDCNRERII